MDTLLRENAHQTTKNNTNLNLILRYSLISFFGVEELSTSDVAKTTEAILKKMTELNRLVTSLMPPEQKKSISKYVQLLTTKILNAAFDLMRKTVSLQKDLDQTKTELTKEVISSCDTVVEKYAELNLYIPPVATASILSLIDQAMELGMKIGAVSATATIDFKEKMIKKLIENMKKTAQKKGYIA